MNKRGQKKETGIKFICKYIWLSFYLPSSVEIWDYHMNKDKIFCFLFTDEFVISSSLDSWVLAFDVLVFDWVMFDRVLWNVLWVCVVCQSYVPQVAVLPLALRMVFLCLSHPLPSHKRPPNLGVEIRRAVCHLGRRLAWGTAEISWPRAYCSL